MATDEAGNAKDQFDEDTLFTALSENDNETFHSLINACQDINIRGPEGNHLLHVSVANGNLEITKHLIDIGSDVNAKNENHNTPLHLSVERNDSEMTQYLLENGADANIGDKSNMTALHRAVRKNNAEISQHLIDNGADVNVLTEKRESALHTAALKNYPDMARLLVEKGADLETLNLEGFTAIQIAAECCHFEIVEYLLEKGADRRDIDKYKLHLAAGRGDRQLVEQYLLEDYDIEFKNAKLGHTALHWAAKNGAAEVIQTLLQHGAEVNSMDMLTFTQASYEGHADVVRALIKAGANKESVNHDGHRAVHDAAAKGHLEVIKILLEEGADKNVLNAHGESPLIQAAEFGHADVVKVLLDAGADRHLPNDYGVYPICQIARRYNDYVVEHQGNTSEATFSMLKTLFYFLEAGSYVNTETKETLCKLQNIAKIICHRPNGQVEVHDILAKDIDDKVQHEFGIGSELSIMIFGMERQVLKTIIRLFGNRHVRSLILGNMDVSLINKLEGRLGISHSVVIINSTSFNQYVTMSWLLDTVKVVCFIACDLVVPYKIQFLGRPNVLNVSHCKLMPKSEKQSNLNGRKYHSSSTRTRKLIQPRLHSVKELFLNNNGLTDLPEDIGDIQGLVVFSAHDNNIHNIPSTLINKSDYESFSIHNNPAVLIPVALQEDGRTPFYLTYENFWLRD
ncbi:putative ankyrin repeat protein RF_0381 [Ptychodera flava]|uniref:putative ankyrin repeat protein RF_0381 n=1 Tax=Ptychodera flava TaxID=63121 RepID=UPI00396AA470